MIEAVITGIVGIVVCVISGFFQMKQVKAQNSKTVVLIDYRLEQLEKKVDKHNSIVERTYKLEEFTTLQEEKIKVANHRIEDLEKERRT